MARKVCGACRSPLAFLGKFKPDGSPAKQRAAGPPGSNKFMQFAKVGMCVCRRRSRRLSCYLRASIHADLSPFSADATIHVCV